jgi:hypothetical protein
MNQPLPGRPRMFYDIEKESSRRFDDIAPITYIKTTTDTPCES